MDDASPSPEVPPPRRRKAPPSPPEPKKPAIAEKAHDLEAIRKALEDATNVGAGFWLSYLFLMFYIAIAAGAVTHVDLLLETPVKLPFLNVELPLKAFFFLAPIIFIIVHAFALTNFALLADKTRRFHNQLHEQLPDDAADREGLRQQLPSNIFVQLLAGPRSVRESKFIWLLQAMAWISMAVAPVLLLLLLQVQFLPYHESWLTWEHRLALLVDLALLWWLWRKIISSDRAKLRSWAMSAALSGAGVASLAALVFAFVIATFPGEWRAYPWPAATELAFKSLWWPKNTLDLPEINIWEALKLDDPKKLDWKEHTIVLEQRHLEGADFVGAKLGKADLSEAQLQGASLNGAHLQGATLYKAQLQGAQLVEARLQVAWLRQAQLQGALLLGAQLQGASLNGAQLQGASLDEAQLQGASFSSVQFFPEERLWAQLQGASLHEAQLQGAWLNGAQLQGALLGGAQLQGVSLRDAELRATDLRGAFLWRSNWSDARKQDLFAQNWSWRPETPLDIEEEKTAPWSRERYEALRKLLTDSVPAGRNLDNALKGIEVLKCETAPCAAPAEEAQMTALRLRIEKEAGVDEARYRAALSENLRGILCGGDTNAIHILRGVMQNKRISATGPGAPALVDFVMSDKCPVSAALTEDDKGRLREIKRLAAQKYPPPAPPPAQKPK